jgi:hypothetical protein
MAACTAARVCQEIGGQAIYFEGDALQAVNAVNSEKQNWSRNGHLAADMKQLLLSFPQWKCCHLIRTANNAAHIMAKVASHQAIDYTWREVILDHICDVISMEQIVLSVDWFNISYNFFSKK